VRHQDQILFDVRPVAGEAIGEVGTATHEAAWLSRGKIDKLLLSDRAKDALGVMGLSGSAALVEIDDRHEYRPQSDRGQRFSAYGVVTDPDGRLLLTLIAENYPGAGTWHLPGGGTEFGEDSAVGLLRELLEETGQVGRITEFLWVVNQHNPAALGPEGRPLDWHGVRVVYRVVVDVPTVPIVREVGGSTAAAGWFTPAEAVSLRLNRATAEALDRAGLFPDYHF
jgi:ADP-ribose pyrophosphatase YjhB (NUDIX family)